MKKALELIEGEKVWAIENVTDATEVTKAIKTSLSAKLAEYVLI